MEAMVQVFRELHYQYTEQFLAALLPMALTVVIHGQGMGLAGRYFKRFGRPAASSKRTGPHVFVLIMIVAIMLAAHYIEINVWAIFYFLTDMLPDYRAAVFYSVNSYTTLGASNITLPGRWLGLGGFEAMTAMLMFGWSTAILAVVIGRLHNLDAPGKN
jgi:hypothetical protein